MLYVERPVSEHCLPASWFVPAHRRRVLVLRNPKSGPRDRSRLFRSIIGYLRAEGYQVDDFCDIGGFTQAVEDSAVQQQLRCVIPAGGDGTCALVARLVPPGIPLAPLTLGNENVMARWFGYRPRPDVLGRAIGVGRAVTLDAGEANGRLFLFVLSCGFDAQVVHLTHERRRGHAGHLAYLTPLCRTLWKYTFPLIDVEPVVAAHTEIAAGVNPAPWKAPWVFLFNLPCYAMGIPVCRDARPADGLLDVCTFPPRSVAASLYHLAHVLWGGQDRLDGVRHERLGQLRLSSAEPVYYQCDGDPMGTLPVTVRVVPQRWSILLP